MEKTISSCGEPVPNKKKTVRPPILYIQLATSLNCPCFRRTIFILHGSIRDDVCGELGLHDATIRRKISLFLLKFIGHWATAILDWATMLTDI